MIRTSTRFLGASVIALLSATTLAACGGSNNDGAGLLSHIESGQVTLGTKFDQPGLGMKEASGGMSGLDVDIAQYVVNHIADAKGWKHPDVEWRETPLRNVKVSFKTEKLTLSQPHTLSIRAALNQ